MKDSTISFQVIDWNSIPKTEHKGITGSAYLQTIQFHDLSVMIVEYTKGYMADHWCQKGHIVHCLDGEFVSELENGNKQVLKKGMTYIVSDNMSSHRSSTESGAKLLIIDGEFLQQNEVQL